MIGYYSMMPRIRKVIHYSHKSKQINYAKSEVLLNKNDSNVTVSTNKDDRKIILGYDCYKLIVLVNGKEHSLGNTTYEMYVTDKIDLPANSVVFGPEVQPGLFTFGNIS